MNAAVAYLVLARGTGGDQRTTSWSTNAIEKYTGIARGRAKLAIAMLEQAGLLERICETQQKPKYRLILLADQEWIWLPNALVTGAANETPPIELIRQTANVNTLRLFIDLYSIHDLKDEGGIDRRQLCLQFDRFQIGEHGPYNIWGFVPAGIVALNGASILQAHLPHDPAEEEFEADWATLGLSIETLKQIGLLEFVAHLLESDDDEAEILHPLPLRGTGEPEEQSVTIAAVNAARTMLTDGQVKWAHDSGINLVLPVLAHMRAVSVVGVGRLRYRPKTALTGAWLGRSAEWKAVTSKFKQLAAEICFLVSPPEIPLSNHATSRGHQRSIKVSSRGRQDYPSVLTNTLPPFGWARGDVVKGKFKMLMCLKLFHFLVSAFSLVFFVYFRFRKNILY